MPVLQGVVTVFTQCREKVDVVCKSCARPNKNRNFRPRNTPDFQTKSRCRRQSKFRRKFLTGSRRCPTRRAFNARRVKHRMRSRHKAFALILGHSAPESRSPGCCCGTGTRPRRRSTSTQRSSNQHCPESYSKSTRPSRHSTTHRRYGCDSRKRDRSQYYPSATSSYRYRSYRSRSDNRAASSATRCASFNSSLRR